MENNNKRIYGKNSNFVALYDFDKYDFTKDRQAIGVARAFNDDFGKRLFIDPLYIKRIIRKNLQEEGLDIYFSKKNLQKEQIPRDLEDFKNQYIDIRMFGIGEGKRWPYLPIFGSIGISNGLGVNKISLKENRIDYGIVHFHGKIMGGYAKNSGMTEEDIKHFDKCIVNSSDTSLAGTRNIKFYMRTETSDTASMQMHITDELLPLERFEKNEMNNSINDYFLNITKFVKYLCRMESIQKIYMLWDPGLKIKFNGEMIQDQTELISVLKKETVFLKEVCVA